MVMEDLGMTGDYELKRPVGMDEGMPASGVAQALPIPQQMQDIGVVFRQVVPLNPVFVPVASSMREAFFESVVCHGSILQFFVSFVHIR